MLEGTIQTKEIDYSHENTGNKYSQSFKSKRRDRHTAPPPPPSPLTKNKKQKLTIIGHYISQYQWPQFLKQKGHELTVRYENRTKIFVTKKKNNTTSSIDITME